MIDLVKVVNEKRDIVETTSVTLGLYFELTEPVSISGIKKSSDDITIEFNKSNNNQLIGFRIKVKDFQSDKDISKAYQRAFRLTTLISLKTGMFIFHKRPRKIVNDQITASEVGISMDAILTKLVNLDMTDNEISKFVDNDHKINQQVAHFANGQKALHDANYAEAIKEFYQVIEYENLTHLEKYKYLRHGVSHVELNKPKTIDKLKDKFGIICIENPNSILKPKGKYVDITSPDVQEIIEKEAKKLREEVIQYIDTKLNIQTN